jgi:hypothetical protein
MIHLLALAALALTHAVDPTSVPPPLPAPVVAGPMTVTLVDSYYSTAASQLVVVVEMTTTETVSPRSRGAVYVGPDGQQVEASDSIEPNDVFPDATAVVVVVFPAATPGGTMMWTARAEDAGRIDITLPVPA